MTDDNKPPILGPSARVRWRCCIRSLFPVDGQVHALQGMGAADLSHRLVNGKNPHDYKVHADRMAACSASLILTIDAWGQS